MDQHAAAIFWGAVLRMAQALVEAAPTLLCGLLVVGVMRRMLGAANTVRLFGGQTWRGIPQAWALGMLLPVCSLGVIPVLRELKRLKVSGGTILAFGLTAPLFNPISFLYGLTLSEPIAILTFGLASLVVVTAVGLAWDWLFPPPPAEPVPELPPLEPGLRRMSAVLVDAGRELLGPTLPYVLQGLLGVGVVAALLPYGCMEHAMRHDDPWSPVLTAAIALPIYLAPMRAMMQLGLIFDHGNSVGSALTLLLLGAGVNLGLLVWVVRGFGLRRSVVWLLMVLTVVLSFAYAVEQPLYPAGKQEANHTHAFDDFTCPFEPHDGRRAATLVWPRLTERIEAHEYVGLGGLAGLGLLGLLVRLLDRRWSVDRFLQRRRAVDAPLSVWNRPIPGRVLAVIGLTGLLVLSVIGCYIYYPPPTQVMQQMFQVKGEFWEALRSDHLEYAQKQIRLWDDLLRKMEVGRFLRTGRTAPELLKINEAFREELEAIHDAIAEDRPVLRVPPTAADFNFKAFGQLEIAPTGKFPGKDELPPYAPPRAEDVDLPPTRALRYGVPLTREELRYHVLSIYEEVRRAYQK